MDRARRISSIRAAADLRWWSSVRNAALFSAPKQSGCATTWRAASTAIISRRAGRSRSRSSAPKVRSKMPSGYFPQLFALVRGSFVVLGRPPSSPQPKQAFWRLIWQTSGLAAVGTTVIIALMIWVDAWEIGLMPPRGAPSLWPFHILTDLGKDAYVLCLLFTTLIITALLVPRSRDPTRARLLGFAARAGYLFLAVLVPVLIAEILK